MAHTSLSLRLSLFIPSVIGAAVLYSCGGGGALDSRYVAVHNAMTSLGMSQVGAIQQGAVNEGQATELASVFEPGQCYTVVGLASDGIGDLDLAILDESGNEIATDVSTDSQPAAQFCPSYPSTYRIRVRAERGSGQYLVTSYLGGSGAMTAGPDPETPARLPHGGPGTCEEPYTIEVGGSVRGDTTQGDALMAGSCVAGGDASEQVYAFMIDSRSRVSATLDSSYDASLYLLGTCGEVRSELACNDDAEEATTSRSRIAATLEPGTYFLVVDGFGSSVGTFELQLRSSPMQTPQQMCANAPRLEHGQTVSGSTVDQPDYFQATCASQAQSPDRVYMLEIERRSRVSVRMQSTYDGALHLRSDCENPASEVACNDDAPDTRNSEIRATLEPGRYYVFADGFGSEASGDFSITANVVPEPAAGTANGDLCTNPIPVTTAFDADTALATDQFSGSCGGQASPELVYRLDLANRSRVRASIGTSAFGTVMYLQRRCGDATSEIRCISPSNPGGGLAILGGPAGARPPNPGLDEVLEPGTYFLVVDGVDATNYGQAHINLSVEDLSRLNTECQAAPLLRQGTQMVGTTQGASDRFSATCGGLGSSPDAIYRLRVTRRSSVRISSEQTDFDGVISLRTDCSDAATEVACSDDAGDNRHSLVDTFLEPGTYYVIVDGFSNNQQGPFTLDVFMTRGR